MTCRVPRFSASKGPSSINGIGRECRSRYKAVEGRLSEWMHLQTSRQSGLGVAGPAHKASAFGVTAAALTGSWAPPPLTAHFVSDADLLGDFDRIIGLDAEVANGAFDL